MPMDPNKSQNGVKLDQVEGRKVKHLLGLPPPVWRVVYEYCQQASLHGLRYISSPDLPYIERYLWLGVFLSCVGVAIHLIFEVWELWREKPFFITFDSHMTPIWAIPFPSVTICTYVTIKKSVLDLATIKNETLIYYASLVCPLGGAMRKKITLPDHVDFQVYKFLLEASPSCEEMLKVCSFQGHKFNCCEVFEPQITDFGLCYSFNKLPAHIILSESAYKPYPGRKFPPEALFWNPDEGYPVNDEERHNNQEKIFPRWSQVAGEYSGLFVELFQNSSEWQSMCSGGFTGFQVKVANPADLPVWTKVDDRIGLSRETSLMLTPSQLGAYPDLAAVPIHVRACYFTHEKRLRFFNTYTYSNCFLECSALQTLEDCGCVPISFPHFNDTRICSTHKDTLCLQIAKNKQTIESMSREAGGYTNPCNCLQGCQEIVYQAIDFYTNFIYTGIEPPWSNGTKIGPHAVTRLTVYYRNNQFLGQHRVMRYTNLKFAGTCGGLLSLLLGFSVISAIEIVYAFVLRPINRALLDYCHRHRRNNVIVVEPANTKQPPSQPVFSVTGAYTSQRRQFLK